MNICIRESCIRCGHCVRVCPVEIFRQEVPSGAIELHKVEHCIGCGHCVGVCPTGSVCHEDFPAERVHRIDRQALPSPEEVEQLIASRRSNRAMRKSPVPQELLDRIVAAANRAPTATNAQQLSYTLVTDPEVLYRISEYTLTVFGKVERRLSHVLVKPWLRLMIPGVYRYVPAFRKMRRDFAEGKSPILRGATAVLFIHAPKENRFCVEDANLAYQNASLMAEALGVSQIYMGFVMTAIRQDKGGALLKMLGQEGRRVGAIMALGMPEFRYLNYIDRKPPEVVTI